MLANTLVGYTAAWGRAVFFADNLLVNAGFIAAGVWLRDLLVLRGERHRRPGAGWSQLGVWTPAPGAHHRASPACWCSVVFRDWLDIRLDE